MDDLSKSMATIREDIEVAWDDTRIDKGRERFAHGLKRQAQIQAAVRTSALLILLGGAVGAGTLLDGGETPPVARGISPAVRDAEFSDGSHGILLGEDSEFHEVAAAPDTLEVELRRGGALFSVVRDERRTFRVSAGRAAVEVLGTTFSVQRNEADESVSVSVFDGRVRVMWDDQVVTVLERGESIQLPPRTTDDRSDPPVAEEPAIELEPDHEVTDDESAASAATPRSRVPAPAVSAAAADTPAPEVTEAANRSWQDLAQSRDYEAAHAALSAQGTSAVTNTPRELMLAADAARLSGHPAEAAGYLRQMLQGHSTDARAALASFTLGRILLHQLGQPSEAARAFRRARQLRPSGSLSEDALAREVESWSRAGNTSEAQRLAREYEARYPNGRRLQAVRRHARFE